MPFKPPRYQPPNQPRRAADTRPTAAQRGYGYRWQQFRRAYLAAHPLCAECERQGRVTEATVVDHIIPHKGDESLFWSPDDANLQPLCRPCHSTKTATSDGGFGRAPKRPGEGDGPPLNSASRG